MALILQTQHRNRQGAETASTQGLVGEDLIVSSKSAVWKHNISFFVNTHKMTQHPSPQILFGGVVPKVSGQTQHK